MKNKYIYILIILLILIGILVVFRNNDSSNLSILSHFSKSKDSDKNPPQNISLKDATKALYKSQKGLEFEIKSIGTLNLEFLKQLGSKDNKITDSINGGIDNEEYKKIIEAYIGEKRTYTVDISAVDYLDNKNISLGSVYLNSIKIGELKDGKLVTEFVWPKGIEIFNFIVRSPGYGDGFYTMNALNSEGTLIIGNVSMKKNESQKVTLDKQKEIQFKNFGIVIPECSLVRKDGTCFKGEVTIDGTYITGEEANNRKISLGNLKAISDDGNITSLVSGGMAFINIYDNDGNMLKVGNNKTVTIEYKVSTNDIEKMKAVVGMKNGKEEGYWYFDKNNLLWEKKIAKISLDEKNLIWSAEVSEIY